MIATDGRMVSGAPVAQRGQGGQLRFADRGVEVGGDPLLGHLAVRHLQSVGVLRGRERGNLLGHEPDRVVLQDASGLAALPAFDLAAGRVRRGRRDSGELERARVSHPGVAAEVDNDDRSPRRQPVEILLRGLAVHPRRLPEIDRQPAVRLLVGGAGEQLADRREELLQIQLAVVQARLCERQAAGQRVAVSVVDPRHKGAAAELDLLRAGADIGRSTAVGAHIGDAPTADCDGLRHTSAPHCQHLAPAQHQVRWPGLLPERRRRDAQCRPQRECGAVAHEATTRDASLPSDRRTIKQVPEQQLRAASHRPHEHSRAVSRRAVTAGTVTRTSDGNDATARQHPEALSSLQAARASRQARTP